jgi:hypothetical protein
MKYILVDWPESQEFIGRDGCYFCQINEDDDLSLDQAIFVPENVYDHYINGNINTI